MRSHSIAGSNRRLDDMHLDLLTLMVPGAFAAAVGSLLLFGAWLMFKEAALLWWSGSHLSLAIGLAVLIAGFVMQSSLLVIVGTGVRAATPLFLWIGAQQFASRTTPLLCVVVGPMLWLATSLAPLDVDHRWWSVLSAFVISFVFTLASVWSLWSGRAENLNARWPLVLLLAAYAAIEASALSALWSGTFSFDGPAALNSWFGAVHFERIVYAIGTTIFMVLLCKERIELSVLNAAKVDPLTGTMSRGAFFELAERLFNRCRQAGSPYSVIMFDLDHFKSINDGHGHRAGDRILQAFAKVARETLRPNDVLGRYGGEEFTVILPNVTVDAAYVIAERVRHNFANACKFMEQQQITATVSGGVATASAGMTLQATIDAADKALYAAKRSGRNRVHRAEHYEGRMGRMVSKLA